VQLVRTRHEACGETTLVRLPPEVPARAVRVVVCGSCRQTFEVDEVTELGALAPARRERAGGPATARGRRGAPRRNRPSGSSRSVLEGRWALLAVPAALAAVIGALLLIQGGSGTAPGDVTTVRPNDAKAAIRGPGATAAKSAGVEAPNATFVRGSTYTLALPPGWRRATPLGGATLAARSSDGSGDATLWIQRDPGLTYPAFVKQSLARLRALAGSARVVDTVDAPTPDGTIFRLEANAPRGGPSYDVTLRVGGPYRYYLATTLAPNASEVALKGVQLVTNSLTPTPTSGATP
jgi:hypothetical protein